MSNWCGWKRRPTRFLRLVDVKALAEKAKAAGALVGSRQHIRHAVSATALDMGCDFVFHSATKYCAAIPTYLMGVVVAKTKELAQPLHDMMVHTGAIAGPMDCWLVLRGYQKRWLYV